MVNYIPACCRDVVFDVNEANMHGRRVAAHEHGAEGIKTAIRAGIDSIEHAFLIDAEGVELAKRHGTYLVMDVYNGTFILEYGMSPMQALQATTTNAADLIGWPNDAGAIAEGFYADIIAVGANPLDDITVMENVGFVTKGGQVIKRDQFE